MSRADVFEMSPNPTATPMIFLEAKQLASWASEQTETTRLWLGSTKYGAKPGQVCLLPDEQGHVRALLVGVSTNGSLWEWASVANQLPQGCYRVEGTLSDDRANRLALGWGLASYRFTKYRTREAMGARLVPPKNAAIDRVRSLVDAIFLVRDLITTPANDMGPAELEAAAHQLAADKGLSFHSIVGDDLLAENYPAIHAVGRAASAERAPRLIEMSWGDPASPKVSLVGKGVCFDSGGLDLKPARSMKLMKKDMGGAAHVLGLAGLIVDAQIPVRLRVLLPAVENSVSSSAMRPLDVIRTRSGKTIEIGNTDAEGRVILSDCLSEASQDEPSLLLDFATLTGAARVALGGELPALFTNDDDWGELFIEHSRREQDPLWRMPLFQPYRQMIEGKTADLTNSPDSPLGGAITAALFLGEFVGAKTPWAHVDVMAWNPVSRPGRPEGGEAMGLRACLSAIESRFA